MEEYLIDYYTRARAIRDGLLIDVGHLAPGPADYWVCISRKLVETVSSDPEALGWILEAGFKGFETYQNFAVPSSSSFEFLLDQMSGGPPYVEVVALFDKLPSGDAVMATYVLDGEAFDLAHPPIEVM